MGLDMYLYKNEKIDKETKKKIKDKTFNWDDPYLKELNSRYTLTIAREDNTRPIPESIKKVATICYINQEGIIPAELIGDCRPDIDLEKYVEMDFNVNKNGSFEVSVYLKDKKEPEVIFLSKKDMEKYTKVEKETVYVYSSYEIMYWRKSNQIRQWFVNNLSEKVENCENSTVTKENLEKLISDCEEVLKNKDKAKDVIPTKSGFYFGSTEYDEYYFSDIKHTLEKAKDILAEMDWENESLYYSEWW